MKQIFCILAAAGLVAGAGAAVAEGDYDGPLTDLANGTIHGWVTDPAVLDAVRAQNAAHHALTEADILALDAAWREQVITGGALIDGILGNALSAHLRRIKDQGAGHYTEIFVTDAHGLNVGQSSITSDYWQGDEDKWQVPQRTSGIHIGDIEFDESAQTYQSQVSVPILDDGTFIGAITVGVDIQMLASAN